MNIDDYLELVAKRLKDAQAQGDKTECIRLLRLVATTATEKADEIEKTL